MIVRDLSRANLTRIAGTTAFVAVLVGLPVAVQVSDMPGGFTAVAVLARAVGDLTIRSPLKISDRLPLTLDAGRVTSRATGNGSEARTPISIVVEDGALTLDLSQRAPGAEPASGVPDSVSPVAPLIAGLSSGTMLLNDARLTVVGPEGGRSVLRDVNATVTVSRKGSYKLVGSGQMNGRRFSVDAIWSDSASRDADAQVPLKLALAGEMMELSLDGLFKAGAMPSFVGQSEARIPNLGRFAAWAGLGTGIEDYVRDISVSGPLEWVPSQMMFTRAAISVDGKPATGALTLRHGGSRPALDATLGFAEFDLTSVMSRRGALVSRNPGGHGKTHILAAIDADLRLSASKLTGAPVELGRGAISIAINRGRIQADIAELDLEGGTAAGQLTLDLNEPQTKASLKLKVKGMDAGRVLASPLKRNALLGRANVSFEGTAQGKTIGEVAAKLTGKGQFEITEPARLGLDIAALMHAARGGELAGWAAAGKGSTPLETLAGRFRVIDGALTVESMQARSGAYILMGQGQVDVPGRLVDMSISSSLASTSEVTVATAKDVLLLRGTWESPDIRVVRSEQKAEAPAQPR